MSDWAKLSREAERYKKEHPVGSRIVLLSMGNDARPIPNNTRGTVRVVDDIGQIHCDFDNGRHLAIVPGEDSFRLLTEKELAEERRLDEKAASLKDFFWAQGITMSVTVKNGDLIAQDDEGNKWVGAKEIYNFALNECCCFEADGSLSSGFGAAEAFIRKVKEDAKEFGVEITSYVKSVDKLIGNATKRSKETNGSEVSEVEFEKE